MISRDQLRARLLEANYTYVTRAKRTELYRQKGGVQRVHLPLRDWFREAEAATILQQAGLTPPQIQRFLAGCIKN